MNEDTNQAPSDEEIARYAYHLWESEGRQHGRDMEYWFEAKVHLTARRQHDAGTLQSSKALAPTPQKNQVAKPATPEVKTGKQRKPGSPRAYA